jgi:hypothetical protein
MRYIKPTIIATQAATRTICGGKAHDMSDNPPDGLRTDSAAYEADE